MLSWYARPLRPPSSEEILVKLIPPTVEEKRPVEEKPAPRAQRPPPIAKPPQQQKLSRETPLPPERPAPAELPPGQPAPVARSGAELPAKNPELKATETHRSDERNAPPEFDRSQNGIIVRRELPSLKELLPPLYRSTSEERSSDRAPVRLDNRDPAHIAYMNRVKQALDIAWNDPRVVRSASKPWSFEGRPVVQFVIREDGEVEDLHLIQTSGYSVLDQEAIQVVLAAAPHFGAIPRSVGKRSILIDLAIRYENRGMSYSFTPR